MGKQDGQHRIHTIQQLMEENLKLNASLRGLQFIPSSTRNNRGKASSLQNQYCMQNDCYTPTEFALFGIGICIAGILIGVIVLAYVKNKCSAEDKLYEYTLDDTHQHHHQYPINNGTVLSSSDERENLVHRSDSGGFKSHKPDSIAALNPNAAPAPRDFQDDPIYYNKCVCVCVCVCVCGKGWGWCGVVWCGVVWCGVVWCGAVRCGAVWCGVVWCGVVRCGVVGCGVCMRACVQVCVC